MKLKTTRHYSSHLTEKLNFLANPKYCLSIFHGLGMRQIKYTYFILFYFFHMFYFKMFLKYVLQYIFRKIFVVQCVQLFASPCTAARQASLPFTISQSLLKLMSIESVMPSNHLLCHPSSSCLQFFPASGSFLMSQLFPSGGQSVGASASALPINIQDWFPLGLTGLISFLSKGLSRVCSSSTVQRHQFFGTQPFLLSSSHIVHDYWENHKFDLHAPL